MNITFGGYCLDHSGERCQLPVLQNPTSSQLINVFEQIKGKEGVLSASYPVTDAELDEKALTLYTESGSYLLLSPEIDQDGDYYLRTLTVDCEDEPIEILGDLYSAKTITHDFELVKKIFLAFCETGDVSYKLIS